MIVTNRAKIFALAERLGCLDVLEDAIKSHRAATFSLDCWVFVNCEGGLAALKVRDSLAAVIAAAEIAGKIMTDPIASTTRLPPLPPTH